MKLQAVWVLAFGCLLGSAIAASSDTLSNADSTAVNGWVDEQSSQADAKAEPRPAKPGASKDTKPVLKLPAGVPAKVGTVLQYIDEHNRPPDDYDGGRAFGNFEGLLRKRDARGRSIRYQEWDVNPKVRGRNRGPERLVTGSDGSAYYTADHYKSFKKIR
jgi:guanyl-specific ribonuclease Sa